MTAAECDYSEECPSSEHDMGCYHEPLPDGMREYMGLPMQDAINAAHERQQWAQQGVFIRKREECPPRIEGTKPHCPDCSGIVGETGIVW